MKRSGFVFVELLAVIVLLTIILSITIPVVTTIIQKVRLNSFTANEKIMIQIAQKYLDENDSYLPVNIGATVEIKLSLLQSEGLISSIKNPWNNNDICDGYILVTKVANDRYDYSPYLKCENNYKADSYTTDGLVAYWKLDGNAYDYTPNQNEGTIQNVSTTTNRFGIPNKALGFSGPSNFVDTNYNYSLNYDGESTFSLWVKFLLDNTDGKIKNIFGKNSREYILSQIDNKIQFTQWDSNGEYAFQLTSNTNIEINKWYNIVIVYNGTDKKVYLYINGVLDAYSLVQPSTFANKAESLKIGRGYPDIGAASSTFFIGTIDNLSIYNRAWTTSEVKLNYELGLMATTYK